MICPPKQSIDKKSQGQQGTHLSNAQGQIVLEYVLLLIIGVVIAVLITSLMFGRNPENPGFMITKWYQIIATIGADYADAIPDND